jgi:putative nucleotidyltransferase with HDIG domain
MGAEAHCRRTATVAGLIARSLSLSAEEQNLLRTTCLLHHDGAGLLAPDCLDRIMRDLFGERALALVSSDRIPMPVREVLRAYETPGGGSAVESRLAAILRLADAFDQAMEAEPIDGESVEEIIIKLSEAVEGGLWPEEAAHALKQATQPVEFSGDTFKRIPAFPKAVMRALTLMRDPRASLDDIIAAASLDPGLAGPVMQLANSALFASRARVATLSQAIARLGFATTQKVITSAAVGPLFASSSLRDTWRHSVRVADIADQLATRAGVIDSAEAYLAGLLHDVGRIALLSLPAADTIRLEEAMSGGCARVYAERLILGTDHAVLGGKIAAEWRLPEEMTEAILQHHRPERTDTPLGRLLYLAECLSGSEEDLPSLIRLERSLDRIGLVWSQVEDCCVSDLGRWIAAA